VVLIIKLNELVGTSTAVLLQCSLRYQGILVGKNSGQDKINKAIAIYPACAARPVEVIIVQLAKRLQ